MNAHLKNQTARLKFVTLALLLVVFFTGNIFLTASPSPQGETQPEPVSEEQLDAVIDEVMTKSKIPGASIVIIDGDRVITRYTGFADLENKIPVSENTLFEIGSCSKSFTALGIMALAGEGLIKMNDPVSKFFPWFKPVYKDEVQEVTVNQLIHHTSGIPWAAFSKIHESDSPEAMEAFLRDISDIELNHVPGRMFVYSNANYAVLGAIIEAATGTTYESFMREKVFAPLGMNDSSIGTLPEPGSTAAKAVGYKIAFGKPRPFESPVYRANFPAGYVLTNGKDMTNWLKTQLGLVDTPLSSYINRGHIANPLLQGNRFRMVLYSMGWEIVTGNNREVRHGGANPNFMAWVGMKPGKKLGIAVMTNSNSMGPEFIGSRILKLLSHEFAPDEIMEEYVHNGGMDEKFSAVSYGLGVLLAICIGIVIYMLIDTFRGVRRFEGLTLKKLVQFLISLAGTTPIIFGIYLIPNAIVEFSWSLALAWTPDSFPVTVGLVISCLLMTNVLFLLSLLFPYKDRQSFRNKYLRPLPMILFVGFISGLMSSAAMLLISASFFLPLPLGYLLYYFSMALFVSVLGQKVVRTKMIVIANNIVYELRMRLITKIFATRYEKFEKIDSGRVYATLNNDTESISNSAGMVVGTVTNLVTAVAAFVYLSAISFYATVATLLFAVLLGIFYIVVGKKSRVLMEKMRDTQNVFMKLIEGLVKGFREISMHHNKKVEYDGDVEAACSEYRRTRISAVVKFVDANLISSSMILILLAAICISFPRLFPEMSLARLISFIMVLLYMIGPITSIMSSFPTFIRIKVSWDRIQKFIKEIPSIEELTHYKEIDALSHKGETVNSIEARGVTFTYKNEDEDEISQEFSVGPIDLKVNKGEIFFIVGGNGSGKTTLAKLLTGLYQPQEGEVLIDGKKIEGNDYLGEYFSIIFDNFTLFEKLYNVNIEVKREEIDKYLDMLHMKDKVELKDGKFSTINLSSGQRKRLALLQCYLEDCPIYLFDEVAADQDPEFRKFFYHDLLQRMKEDGKIIIAITHDDHYFDIADRIIKMDMGKIDTEGIPVIPRKKQTALPAESA